MAQLEVPLKNSPFPPAQLSSLGGCVWFYNKSGAFEARSQLLGFQKHNFLHVFAFTPKPTPTKKCAVQEKRTSPQLQYKYTLKYRTGRRRRFYLERGQAWVQKRKTIWCADQITHALSYEIALQVAWNLVSIHIKLNFVKWGRERLSISHTVGSKVAK